MVGPGALADLTFVPVTLYLFQSLETHSTDKESPWPPPQSLARSSDEPPREAALDDMTIDAKVIAAGVFEQAEQAWKRPTAPRSGSLRRRERLREHPRRYHRGADVIARRHQAIFDTIYAGSTVRY